MNEQEIKRLGALRELVRETFAQTLMIGADTISDTADFSEIHRAGSGHCREITRIDNHFLSRLKLVLHNISVNFRKSHSVTVKALHNKALAAEKACADFLLECYRKLDRRLGREISALLYNHITLTDIKRNNRTRNA